MADWNEDPLRRGIALVIATVIVFVVLGTGFFNDPIEQSLVQGVLFGVAYAIASTVYREYIR